MNVLYTGVTNNLSEGIMEHYLNRGNSNSFAGKYYCYNLLYYKSFQYVEDAIAFEKRIKGWSRAKKEILIKEFNPKKHFLNAEVMTWPVSPDSTKRPAYEP